MKTKLILYMLFYIYKVGGKSEKNAMTENECHRREGPHDQLLSFVGPLKVHGQGTFAVKIFHGSDKFTNLTRIVYSTLASFYQI